MKELKSCNCWRPRRPAGAVNFMTLRADDEMPDRVLFVAGEHPAGPDDPALAIH